MTPKEQTLAWEARWARPVGLATFASVALLIASFASIGSIGGGGEAESLRSVHEHSSTVAISGGLQALAFLLLVPPLVYLFRAAAARAPQMRRQFIGLVVAAPIFLCVASMLNVLAADEAATEFVAGNSTTSLSVKEAKRECRSDRREEATAFREEFAGGGAPPARQLARCAERKRADDRAENAIGDASLRPVSEGLRIGGGLGLAFALAYSCLNGMRVGLLTRFWGSLGIALGVAVALGLILFTLIWFVYFGLLVLGAVPRGRPPAWAAGEAVPWPSPGQEAARRLEGSEEPPDTPGPEADEVPDDSPETGERHDLKPRKRKRRD